MAYKHRRLGSGSSSQAPSSSHPQKFSRLSSVPRSSHASSPALPALAQCTGVSLRPSSSQTLVNSPPRDENVVRGEIIESDAETQLREDADAMNEIIMAVDLRDHGIIGCAYYIAREEKLCLMEDIKMAGLDIIDNLIIHAQPTVILISNRSDEKLEEHLSQEARGIDRGDEASKSILSQLLYNSDISHPR
jgi:DNA mismatch repair protein MSH5